MIATEASAPNLTRTWFRCGVMAACLVAAALTGGCGLILRDEGPRIRVYGSQETRTSTGETVSVSVAPSGIHTVRKGQTLYSIAKAYGTPLRTVISANDLHPPYKLEIDQKLRIPKPSVYTVQKGDTVYAISRRFGVAMNELVRVNGLRSPYTIAVGQKLELPAPMAREQSTQVASASNRRTDAPPAKTGKTDAGFPKPAAKPPEPPRNKKVAALSKPPARSSGKFLWPVRGRVISGFGPKGKGLQNDGLNISAPKGTPVKAAENGVIAYSGSDLASYGNLILIKHSGGFMTAYAHIGAPLVGRGDTVRRGQTIARVGSSGNVDRPQLHFQVRKGKKILNPKGYLGG